ASRGETPGPGGDRAVQRDIRRFIWRYSAASQFAMLGLALASFPFLWLYYEMPKEIVALLGSGPDQIPRLFGIELPGQAFGLVIDRPLVLGLQCLILLALVVINLRFRFWISRLRNLTLERALRRIRFQILALVLRFPLHAFRQRTAGETLAAMGGDLESLCGHVGDTVSVPAYQGGTLAVIMIFLIWQDPLIAAAAASIYPLSMVVVPRLQRKVNELSRERGGLMRGLGERIDETFRLVTDIHANDQTRWTRAWLGAQLAQIFRVRFDIDQRKFAIKAINTLLQQTGPVLFYGAGGLMVLEGRLDVGTLIAAIAAHKDMATPWRELLDWYQGREDARVKYENVLRLFNRPDLLPESRDALPDEAVNFRGQAITVEDLVVRDEGDATRLDRVRLTLAPGRLTALVGPSGGGREVLAQALCGLVEPAAGRISIAGQDLARLPASLVNRRIAYVGPGSGLQARSIADNLAFGLQRQPGGGGGQDLREALLSGNPADPIETDWVDYAAAGVADRESLRLRMVELLTRLGFGDGLFRLGLQARLPAGADDRLRAGIVAARAALAEALHARGLRGLIARFEDDRYNDHATLAENLLFGLPTDPAIDADRLADHPLIHGLLERSGLLGRLFGAGKTIAAVMIELFADLDPGHEMVRRFALVTPAELRHLSAIAGHPEAALTRADRALLTNLPFRVVAARHRLNALDDGLKAAVVRARHQLRDAWPGAGIARFDADAVNPAASILDNVLFGRIASDRAGAAGQVPALAAEILDGLGLGVALRLLGLDFEVGIAGARLSLGERQRISLARALLRRPDVIVLDDVLGALDSTCRGDILSILRDEASTGVTVVAALGDAGHAEGFDRILTLERGRILQPG
ncbi:ATP-binding cassette domain-containing protein, partial [Zavarzinia sp.]|uniref:ATP-binding cassette domain-containing protein n=1 Tax=Zavarzinia sp. TaxID=2027920 RepID=UPI003BB586CE